MTETTEVPGVQVLRKATAPSLSGRSRLAYEVGRNDREEICIRLTGNTAAGAFAQDWTRLPAILTILEKMPRNQTVTSDVLMPLFKERSANMPGFVWSVLLHEGLVRRTDGTRRYEFAQPAEIEAVLKALAEGQGATTRADSKGKGPKGRKGVPAKGPGASRKKK